MSKRVVPLFLLAAIGFGAVAQAQTGPALLINDFRRTDQFELNTGWFVGLPTQTSATNAAGDGFDLRYDQLRIASRIRLSPGESDKGLAMAQPRLGFQLTSIAFDTLDPNFPRRLSDASVGYGMGLFKVDDWIGGVTLGLGYASASGRARFGDENLENEDQFAPFLDEDGNALYGQVNLVTGKTFENGDAFGFVLSYDGNRTIFPDIPLPGFQYRTKVNDDLSYAVGFPLSSLNWDPSGPLSVDINLSLPQDITGRVSLDFATFAGSPVQLYGSVSRRVVAARWDELDDGNQRVFFFQSLAELGFSIEPEADDVKFLIAAGYDMDPRLSTGFDTRQLELLSDVDAGTYIRVTFELRL